MDYRNLIGVPLSQVSIIFIGLLLTLTGIASPTQEMALYLFSVLPIIFTFFSFLANKKHFSKFFHMPILVFITSFIIFLVAGVLTEQIISFETLGSAFTDFLLAFVLSFFSILLTKIMMIYFFPEDKELHLVDHKKTKVLVTVLIAVFIPFIIFFTWNFVLNFVKGE